LLAALVPAEAKIIQPPMNADKASGAKVFDALGDGPPASADGMQLHDRHFLGGNFRCQVAEGDRELMR